MLNDCKQIITVCMNCILEFIVHKIESTESLKKTPKSAKLKIGMLDSIETVHGQ
jgi:hypothetical protein